MVSVGAKGGNSAAREGAPGALPNLSGGRMRLVGYTVYRDVKQWATNTNKGLTMVKGPLPVAWFIDWLRAQLYRNSIRKLHPEHRYFIREGLPKEEG